MGEVYRARDPRLGRYVAIKVLPVSVSSDPDRLRRFEHEARAAATLNHPNILAVHDVGSHTGVPYLESGRFTTPCGWGEPRNTVALRSRPAWPPPENLNKRPKTMGTPALAMAMH